eukprot:493555_1
MPVIRIDINDDKEFKQCEYCKDELELYNTASISNTAAINNHTKTLLSYKHLNCKKCGLYIEFHPNNPKDEALIFLCSKIIPHKHCLCYHCGLLYQLLTETNSNQSSDSRQTEQ